MLFSTVAVLCFSGSALSRTVPGALNVRQEPSATTDASTPNPTICGNIVSAVDSPDAYRLFWAKHAYDCLSTVPFNPAVASRFLKYWNETIQFQSTLAYLKDPPEGYQQPAVDVLQELTDIQQRIDSGFYKSQYAFEADFQLLAYALNDGHVTLSAGILSSFSFASPYEVSSVSIDGKQPPKVYITDDVIYSGREGWEPSPIKTINGEDVVEFLTKYAALNSYGYVEPHAEWNALMSNPALDVQGGLTTFSGGGTFYPGSNLTFTFENNTNQIDTIWLAIWSENANYTGPLTTGGDFYNYFVLGQLPASFDPTRIADVGLTLSSSEGALSNFSVSSYGAFPENPDIAQDNLGLFQGGYVTGYLYEEISTGVLSLPTFNVVPETLGNYSSAILEFMGNASEANMTRIIIDLQRNPGGTTLLPYGLFKLFFPELLPFGGSRRRSFPMGNTMGSAITNFWEALNDTDTKAEISADEWIITNRLNAATGKNFTSWNEYAGPVDANGDFFTLTEQFDFANEVFVRAAFDDTYLTMYGPDQSKWPFTKRLWEPEEIVILTDGTCSSACAMFVEMMTQVGVKTVVAGGLPSTGPMQAVGGTRGASLYDSTILDADIDLARAVDELVDADVNATLPEFRNPDMWIRYSAINLRDQMRENDIVPLQFKYEAADCRIYYTLANLYNFTRLWHDVSAAAWDDPSLCVEGSTGYVARNNSSVKAPPRAEVERPTLSQDNPVVEQVVFDEDPTGGLHSVFGAAAGGNDIVACNADRSCNDNLSRCFNISVACPGGQGVTPLPVCLPPCSSRDSQCPGVCKPTQNQENKVGLGQASHYNEQLWTGRCVPQTGNRRIGCLRNPIPGLQ